MPTTHDGLGPADSDPRRADAEGAAALLLVESLIHGLIERSLLTTTDAIEIIETAAGVQAEVAEAADGKGAAMWRSHAILAFMAASLEHDNRGLNNPADEA